MKTKLIFSFALLLSLSQVNAQSNHQIIEGMGWLRHFATTLPVIQKGANDRNNTEARLDSMHCEQLSIDWQATSREYYFYNNQNLKVKDSTINWNTELPGWTPSSQAFYAYDAQNHNFNILETTWSDSLGAWMQDTFRTVTTFNAQGLPEEVYFDSYDPQLGDWVPGSLERITYNDAKQPVIREAFLIGDNGSESPIARMFIEYDGNNIVSDESELTFDDGASWVLFFAQQYTYENGLPKERTAQIFNGIQLENSEREVRFYDPNDLNIHNEVYSWDGQDWYLYQRCDLFWSGSTTATDELETPKVALKYANPFPGGLVQAPELAPNGEYQVTLQAMDGRVVSSKIMQGNNWQINRPANEGTYVLTVRQNGHIVAASKLVTMQ